MPTIHLHWIDYVIVIWIGYSLLSGWAAGLPALAANLFSFLGSLLLSVKYHDVVGNFLGEKFGIPTIWTTVLGYVIVATVSEMIISGIISLYLDRLPKNVVKSWPSKTLGALLSVVNNLVLVVFILLVILALPIRGSIKKDIKASLIGSQLVRLGERYGGSVTSSLDQAAEEVQRFLTIEPHSKDRVSLDVAVKSVELNVDASSEDQMILLINAERTKTGVGLLRLGERMRDVARTYSRTMFEGHYFSHYDAQGHDAGYRMDTAGISYTIVGENLAYAPEVKVAHRGLMESEGHRRNILDSQFHRVGIGVIDGGPNGRMFTQLFAD